MVIAIAAVAQNGIIGNNNELIWHLPKDLQHFKKLTSGHPVIMGRKTFESLGKPLPNRLNIVITSNKNWLHDGVIAFSSIEDAITFAQNKDSEAVYIIGGGNIYTQSLNFCDKLEITIVHHNFEGDTKFPDIDSNIWQIVQEENFTQDEKNPYDFSFLTYEKTNLL